MNKKIAHLKFKVIITLARLGLAESLHYSFMQHIGVVVFFIGCLLLVGALDTPDEPMTIPVALMLIGITCGGGLLIKIFADQQNN